MGYHTGLGNNKCKKFRKKIEFTGVHCYSFGLECLKDCTLESTIKIFFLSSLLLWNIVWIYDLVQAFKHPMYIRDHYMWIYGFIVYILSAAVSTLLFVYDEIFFSYVNSVISFYRILHILALFHMQLILFCKVQIFYILFMLFMFIGYMEEKILSTNLRELAGNLVSSSESRYYCHVFL